MDAAQTNWIANFIWSIADDVLRDLYVRGKYRDVILPMTVLRRLDAVLEPTKKAVLAMKARLDKSKIANQDVALRQASGQAFYNTSKFTLRDLRARASQQQLKADFEAYLDGFSPNVQDILENFEFRNQIPRLSKADALGTLIEKFLSPDVNLGPEPVLNGDGAVKHPGLDNHAMGTIFEELVRRFNEENNEEAGEHWTPRDAVKLMARLIFLPVADQIESGTYLLYDGACGTGGMLTVAEETLQQLAEEHGKQVATHLYGQEINAETYAISKADLLLKGEGEAADNIVGGPEHSTLSNDAFPSREFDFMLSNPPYGKSWKSDLERMGGKDGLKDPRFVTEHAGDGEFSLVTRSSDGQLMFLVNMLAKMKHGTDLGSRIAEVHNGSSLFTGDAGQGESNIRRWIIENDWLEAIVALPLNMFYNTGIATYIWVLSNRKPKRRRGKVQLIDATQWFKPLRKNMGMKNCELSEDDIKRICKTFLAFRETEQSKIFPNAAFGYWKVTVERPLRLRVDLTPEARKAFRKLCVGVGEEALAEFVNAAAKSLGPGPHMDYRVFLAALNPVAEKAEMKLTAKRLKLLRDGLAGRDETAQPVVKKVHKPGKAEAATLYGRYEIDVDGKCCVVEYEPDTELRDTEQIPLLEDGGIEAFIRREVLPHAPDAWVDEEATRIGYEISFNRYFYKPQPQRSLEEIRADILAVNKETEGLLAEIIGDVTEKAKSGGASAMKSLVFISSVQKELAAERRALKDYIQGDALLGRFFEVFLFEDLPASDRRAEKVYLEEVDRCSIYLGLLGNEYGYEDAERLSPTEREFDRATAAGKHRLIFVKGDKDSERHTKMQAFVRKAGGQLIRRRFNSIPELTALVYSSLVEYLLRAGTVRDRPFDAAACLDATIDDLSRKKVRDFLARAQDERNYPLGPRTPTEKALAHLNLLDRGQPSHAAVLLFGKQPQRFLITSEVKCLLFEGTKVAKPIADYQIYKGTVFELVDQAVFFVMSKLSARVGTRAESNQAPVTYELPRLAVAEAIVNAVAHRDYASNASVQVMLFADRLEVWNPGQLPPSLTPEALRAPHASIPHNPLIAEPLFLTRYVEKAGTGILDMIGLCEEANLPTPEFRQESGQFIQTLWRPKGAKMGPSKAQVEAQEAQVEAQVELPATDVALLKACLEKPHTGQELLLAAGYTKRTGNFKRSMDRLLEAGFLGMSIPEKPTSRRQTYRITDKGRAWLASQTKGGDSP